MLRLHYERLKRGWTQRDLAREAGGLTHRSISEIELGHFHPTPEALERLAEALGITPASVLLKEVVIVLPEEDPESLKAHLTEVRQQIQSLRRELEK